MNIMVIIIIIIIIIMVMDIIVVIMIIVIVVQFRLQKMMSVCELQTSCFQIQLLEHNEEDADEETYLEKERKIENVILR